MELHEEEKHEIKDGLLSSSIISDINEDEDNYVFIEEKYKNYFDNISNIFEDKVEHILNKNFKKNNPDDKNKLLCLNLCVLWQKKFLTLLSKTLNEYEKFKNENCLNNEKEKEEEKQENKTISGEKKKETVLKQKDMNENDLSNTPTTTPNNEGMISGNSMNTNATNIGTKKDIKSYVKNVKIVDNKNIEVMYDLSELNDGRASAELSTEEIYYLLVESKKSENEYKKKIYTFLQYLPLIIKSMENKNYLDRKILEEKLLFTNFTNLNNFQNTVQNEQDNPMNRPCIESINHMHPQNMNPSMNGVDNLGLHMNEIQRNMTHENDNRNERFQLSIEEITNKLNAIVNFNYNLSENLEKYFKHNLGKINTESNNNINAYEKNKNKSGKNILNNTENYNITFASSVNCLNEDGTTQNRKSLVLPLSRINDLSVINNISAKSNNISYEEVNENENEYLFYIYKNNMDKTNLYGLDILTNLNNKVLCKINHIYSLIQFYTMLAKDIFDEM